jgi:transcriptional regulator
VSSSAFFGVHIGGESSVYVPDHFRESRVDVLQAFIDKHPLATLVANAADGLTANHIPLQSRLNADGTGLLRGHIARANSLWRRLESDSPVLVIFTGADTYVSPNWYPSKQEQGKAVPTWNYATVHLKGTIRFIDDASWLREFVGTLTDIHEHPRPHPWHVSDAPADYIEGMLRAIVGFEITVSSIDGKFKGSQNRSAPDRAGVNAALRTEGRPANEIDELAPGSNAVS